MAVLGMVLLCGTLLAQENYYYHTINSHALSVTAGRTVKLNYGFQTSHKRQFHWSATYLSDAYDQEDSANRVEADLINTNLQFKFNLLNKSRFFLNVLSMVLRSNSTFWYFLYWYWLNFLTPFRRRFSHIFRRMSIAGLFFLDCFPETIMTSFKVFVSSFRTNFI